MSVEEAIRLIQIHERARQGRLRAKFMKEIRRQEESEKEAARRGPPTLDHDVAATRIQKVCLKNCWWLNYYNLFCLQSILWDERSFMILRNGIDFLNLFDC